MDKRLEKLKLLMDDYLDLYVQREKIKKAENHWYVNYKGKYTKERARQLRLIITDTMKDIEEDTNSRWSGDKKL